MMGRGDAESLRAEAMSAPIFFRPPPTSARPRWFRFRPRRGILPGLEVCKSYDRQRDVTLLVLRWIAEGRVFIGHHDLIDLNRRNAERIFAMARLASLVIRNEQRNVRELIRDSMKEAAD